MTTHLKKDLEISNARAQYDANAKLLLSHKIILAHILIGVAPEFRNLSPDQVVPLIEGEPKVSHIPVNPGETNAETAVMPVIAGMNTENTVSKEGTILYDIHFYVWAPDRTQKIKIIVDIEAQKSIPSQYDIVTRGIFYNARQISAQLGREFRIPEYNKIKKVYSIWLCMNTPKRLTNTAVEYPICPNNLIGSVQDYGRYDLANVIIVNLSRDVVKHSDHLHLHRFLETLLSPDMKPEGKAEILSEEYNVAMTQDMKRSVNIMCNLSEAILEEGVEKGLEKGRFLQLYELVNAKTITLEQASKSLNMTTDQFTSKLKCLGLL